MPYVFVDGKKPAYIHQEYPKWITGPEGKQTIVENETEHRKLSPSDFVWREIIETESAESQLVRLDAFLKEQNLASAGKSPVDCAIELMRMAIETPLDAAAGGETGEESTPRRGRPPKAN